MICDRCKLDKRVIVTTTIKLLRIDGYTGRERTEVRTSKLCRGCGGADTDDAAWQQARFA